MSPADPNQPNEAARLAQELIDQGYTRRQVARMLGRDASLVSQFFTKGKGASMVGALRQLVRAVRGGERDEEALAGIAEANTTRRRTKTGQKARVRGKDVIGTPGGSMAGRAGKQAIKTGAAHLAGVIHAAAAANGRVALTVRMRGTHFTLPAGSRQDSPGIRRGVVPRADGTEERTYGSAATGGFSAAEWSRRVAASHGDVVHAVWTWLVETGRAVPDAEIVYLEIRTWTPTGHQTSEILIG
ncbi:helix-turn-helix domain containing protein [Streptomyces sp. CB01881]|uniref:helix-turn-helix domain containing protein n=1 Tax=Streptomyces sp. CB01881 TaxID=2078691 RepID=UPI000CDBA751|nr:helix-turn-helix domain containing protein [Streptomyces sp. CB01881]AUY53831.1 helix-turn-helix domain containing protein [Streptomyces sp. CB01881]TYC68838.1 helix-turn-helix domain containing protein [Streptomyces sp. CB01881]